MSPEEEAMSDYWSKPTITVSGDIPGDTVTILGKKYRMNIKLEPIGPGDKV